MTDCKDGKCKPKPKECSTCKASVAAGMSLNICRDIETQIGVDCDKLIQKIESGQMKPLDAVRLLAKKAKAKNLPETEEIEHLLQLATE